MFTFDDLAGKDWMASQDDEAAFFTMEVSVRGAGQLHSGRAGLISALAQEGDQSLAGIDQCFQAFVRPAQGPLVVPQLSRCCQFRSLPFPSDLMRNACAAADRPAPFRGSLLPVVANVVAMRRAGVRESLTPP